jgi:hypothetical protein
VDIIKNGWIFESWIDSNKVNNESHAGLDAHSNSTTNTKSIYIVKCFRNHLLNSNSSLVIRNKQGRNSFNWRPVSGYVVPEMPLCASK